MQRVLAVLRYGAYAQEIVLDAAAVVPIPAAMDFVTAAAFPVAYGTAHLALTHRGHLQAGETLLAFGSVIDQVVGAPRAYHLAGTLPVANDERR